MALGDPPPARPPEITNAAPLCLFRAPFGCVPLYILDEVVDYDNDVVHVTLDVDLTDVRSCDGED